MIDSFLLRLLEYFEDIVPILLITQKELGVRTFCGRPIRVLNPGLHLRLFAIWDASKIGVTESALSCGVQTAATKDQKDVTTEMSVLYTIEEPIKAMFDVDDLEEALMARTCAAIVEWISSHNYDECVEVEKLKGQMFTNLKTYCTKNWGVKILDIAIKQLTCAPAYRLIGLQVEDA